MCTGNIQSYIGRRFTSPRICADPLLSCVKVIYGRDATNPLKASAGKPSARRARFLYSPTEYSFPLGAGVRKQNPCLSESTSTARDLARRSMAVGDAVLDIIHSRSRMTIDLDIFAIPGPSTSGFHVSGRRCFYQARSPARCSLGRVKGELHLTKNRL